MDTPTPNIIRSEVRRPVNEYLELENSIHNDSVAQPLGLRGGTVAGSVHMDQFPPTLLRAFGNEWFETGSLSLNFKNATTDGEPVSVVVTEPSHQTDSQTQVRVEREDGLLVAEGTASCGTAGEATYLHTIDLKPELSSELRIFRSLSPGVVLAEHSGMVLSEDARNKEAAGTITEPLPWYSGPSPWGGPVASPSAIVRMLYRPTSTRTSQLSGGAVGLFGAIEICHVNGPVMADTEYRVQSKVVSVGQSPKTEYVWFDSTATFREKTIATMRMQLRYMKASSSLYLD